MNTAFFPKALPDFALGATMYQIFLRQFTPAGTLKAAEELLPHLAELGIKIAYLCPIFEADDDMDKSHWSPRQLQSGMENPKNPYRMNDYFKIDPEYGTDEDLFSFVQTAHRLGLKIMLDLVFYHCGPKATLLQMDPEMVCRNEDGSPVLGEWNFPILNFKSAKLREYLYDNMLYFVQKFDVDGYRCDVGGKIPLDFWEESRRRIAQVKSDFIMLNEATGKPADEVEAFELVYGFRAFNILKLMRGEITPAQLTENWRNADCGMRLMYFLDNHDISTDEYEKRHERILPRELNDLSLAFIFSLPGMPLLYNGQEIADCNRHSIWANHEHGHHLGIDWSKAVTPQGQARFRFLQELIALRKEETILYEGDFRYLDTDRGDAVFALERSLDGERMLCVFNFSNQPLLVTIPDADFGEEPEIIQDGGARLQNSNQLAMFPYAWLWVKC